MEDTTLQGTLGSGTSNTKDTVAAQKRRESLRKGIISLSGRGFDDATIRQKAYEKGGFDPQEIDSVLNEYNQLKASNFSGQSASNIKQAPDLSSGSAVERQSIADSNTTIQMANDAIDMINGVQTGPIAGRVQGAKQMLPGGGDEKFNKLDMQLSNIKANFMKSISGAAVSDAEVKRLSQFLPSTNDQEEVIKLKLEALKGELKNKMDNTYRTLGIDPNSVPDTIRNNNAVSGSTDQQSQDQQPDQNSQYQIVHPDTGEIKMSGFFDQLGQSIPDLAGKLTERVGGVVDALKPTVDEQGRIQKPEVFGEGGLQAAGQIAGGVNDIFGEALKLGFAALPESTQNTLKETARSIAGTESGQEGLNALQQGGEVWAKFKESNPDLAKDIESVGNIAAAVPLLKGFGAAKTEVGATLSDTKKAVGALSGTDPVARANDQIFRAVKPSITVGKKLDQVKGAMETATREVADRGFKPTNFEEYTKALGETKRAVWKDIEAKIGASNATVDLRSIADDVLKMADDATMQRIDPKAVTKIQKLADTLVSQGDNISISDAESLKQYINAELSGTFGKFKLSNAEQNAKKLITAKIGQQMDDVLSSVPEEFSGLKKTYGALRQAEEDAMKRLIVFGRQNPAGLIESYSKISGLGKIVKGLSGYLTGGTTGSAADIGQGLVEMGTGSLIKQANNADAIIKKAFESIGKSNEGYKSKLFNIRPGMNIQDVNIGKPGYALHPEDKDALTKYIDAVRLKKDMSETNWTAAERLLTKAGISLDQPQSKLANIAEEIVSGKRKLVTVLPGTKTKTIISKKK